MNYSLTSVFYDCYQILNKVYREDAYLSQALADTVVDYKNRAQITKIVYGVLDRDITLSYFIGALCDKSPKPAIKIILKIAAYCIKYLGNKPHVVVNSAVELVKKIGKGGNAGFVNAFLRKFAVTEIPLPTEKIARLSVVYSYPEFAVKRLIAAYGEERAIGIMSADEAKTTVRFSSLADGEKYLTERGIKYEKTPFENVFFADGFKRNGDYDEGVYTFQSIGSVAICDLLEGGDKLFDACAAPGGKSVCLADKFGSVLSADVHPHRVKLIEEYAARMKKDNVVAEVKDATEEDISFYGRFDAVLCDVPCSGLGVVKDNPDIKLRRSEDDLKSLNETQSAILNVSAKYVKVGGHLYYSTCSVLDEENDKIIEKFLKNNDNYEICETSSPLLNERRKYGLGFFPDVSSGAGFYFCKMKRVKA